MLPPALKILPFLLLVPAVVCVAAPEITSVQPSSVIPGERVTMTGESIRPGTRVVLGEWLLEPRSAKDGQLEFLVPKVPAGDYALGLMLDGARSAGDFILHIENPPPRILEVSPATVTVCDNGSVRVLTLTGTGFARNATLMLDGSSLPILSADEEELQADLPGLTAGRHRLQVVNPDGRESLPASLEVDGRPRIDYVGQGEVQVNSYQVKIVGTNFTSRSSLLVNDRPVTPRAPHQVFESETLDYVDCNTLIYNRFPVTSQDRDLLLRVINPDGEATPPFPASLP